MKLSFIIPVYNVGLLLDKCLDSLYRCGLDENQFEVIVIKDISKVCDVEEEVINKYYNAHTNITVFESKNDNGPGAPRNIGIKNAKGDYIWFIDSDDTISPDYSPLLIEKIIDAKLDVLCFGFNMIEQETGNTNECIVSSITQDKIFSGKEFLLNVPMPVMPWCAIYDRHFLLRNSILFIEGVLHEDQDFSARTYFLSSRISYIGLPVYNYLQRHGSIMKSVNPKKIRDLITICNRLWNFAIKNTENNSDIRYFFINRISFLYAQCLRNMAICGYENYPNLPFYPLSINSFLNNREKLQYSLININVRFYVFIKSMMFKLRISNRTSH